jgi:predicted ATPase
MTALPRIDIAGRECDQDAHQSHHRLLSLEVAGGFLDGTRLEFSDGLNCIIGGRGTGKTTALEFIRYILGMMPASVTHTQYTIEYKGTSAILFLAWK